MIRGLDLSNSVDILYRPSGVLLALIKKSAAPFQVNFTGLLGLAILFLIACSAQQKKEIKEHRWLVSIGKQIVAPGFGVGK